MVCLPSILVSALVVETAVSAPVTIRDETPKHELVGVVLDIANVPIPEAEVSIVKPDGLDRRARTGKEGRFVIRDIPAGTISIQVRRLGYEARTIEVNIDEGLSTSVEVMLKPAPEQLEDLTVTEDDKETLREYFEHKATRSSYAKFFDGKDIRKRGASNISDLFRSVPSVSISASGSGGNAVRVRGCQPMLWVNGQRIPGSEVDDIVSPNDVAGLEFYQSMAGIPAQYMDRSTRACGSILVWTKNR